MDERWPIVVPKENVNDDIVTLLQWLVPHGSFVAAGSPVAEIETSKAVYVLTTDREGYVFHAVKEREEVPVGHEIAFVSSAPLQEEMEPPLRSTAPQKTPSGVRFSRRAAELMAVHGVDESIFAAKAIVREQDVLDVVQLRGSGARVPAAPPSTDRRRGRIVERRPLTPRKRTEIRYLASGNREALLSAVTVIGSTDAIDKTIVAAADSRRLSILDFIVPAAAKALRRFREFNAFLENDHVCYYADVNVGVALSLEQGLLAPVVRAADQKTVEEVSHIVGGLAMKYLRGELHEEDLVGATFTVSDLSPGGAFQVLPLLNRDQSAVLGIGRDPRSLSSLILTLMFDHRVADGYLALQCLNAIREELESGSARSAVVSAGAAAPLSCGVCLNTLARLREEGVAGYLVVITRADGTQDYVCPLCLVGWGG